MSIDSLRKRLKEQRENGTLDAGYTAPELPDINPTPYEEPQETKPWKPTTELDFKNAAMALANRRGEGGVLAGIMRQEEKFNKLYKARRDKGETDVPKDITPYLMTTPTKDPYTMNAWYQSRKDSGEEGVPDYIGDYGKEESSDQSQSEHIITVGGKTYTGDDAVRVKKAADDYNRLVNDPKSTQAQLFLAYVNWNKAIGEPVTDLQTQIVDRYNEEGDKNILQAMKRVKEGGRTNESVARLSNKSFDKIVYEEGMKELEKLEAQQEIENAQSNKILAFKEEQMNRQDAKLTVDQQRIEAYKKGEDFFDTPYGNYTSSDYEAPGGDRLPGYDSYLFSKRLEQSAANSGRGYGGGQQAALPYLLKAEEEKAAAQYAQMQVDVLAQRSKVMFELFKKEMTAEGKYKETYNYQLDGQLMNEFEKIFPEEAQYLKGQRTTYKEYYAEKYNNEPGAGMRRAVANVFVKPGANLLSGVETVLGAAAGLVGAGVGALTGVEAIKDWSKDMLESAASGQMWFHKTSDDMLDQWFYKGTEQNEAEVLFSTASELVLTWGIANAMSILAGGVEALLSPLTEGAKIAATVEKVVPMARIGASSFAQSTEAAYKEGATLGQSYLYGISSAALEVLTENIANGIPGIKNIDDGELTKKIADELTDNPQLARYLKKLLDTLGEGGEEVISQVVTPYMQRAIYNKNAKTATADDIVRAFFGGVIISSIMTGGFDLADYTVETVESTVKNIQTKTDTDQSVQSKKNVMNESDAAQDTKESQKDLSNPQNSIPDDGETVVSRINEATGKQYSENAVKTAGEVLNNEEFQKATAQAAEDIKSLNMNTEELEAGINYSQTHKKQDIPDDLGRESVQKVFVFVNALDILAQKTVKMVAENAKTTAQAAGTSGSGANTYNKGFDKETPVGVSQNNAGVNAGTTGVNASPTGVSTDTVGAYNNGGVNAGTTGANTDTNLIDAYNAGRNGEDLSRTTKENAAANNTLDEVERMYNAGLEDAKTGAASAKTSTEQPGTATTQKSASEVNAELEERLAPFGFTTEQRAVAEKVAETGDLNQIPGNFDKATVQKILQGADVIKKFKAQNGIDSRQGEGYNGRKGAGTVKYYRVQTPGKNGSMERIIIKEDGTITITTASSSLNLSYGTLEHALYFKALKGGNSYIIEFEVDDWFHSLILENAIPQKNYKTNIKNQGNRAPKIVDETTPGNSMEFPPFWTKWFEEYAKNGKILE